MTVTLEHPRYQFDRWIAAGGMGEVWQATDTLLEREVAVKVLRRDLAQDPVLRTRFAAEARHAGALQHPHVASVLDYGEITGAGPTPLPFLVMELVEGQPLSALLADGQPLDPRTAADLIAQAAEGIEAAHAIGIVHRDVKPGNLLVTAEGQVKVTDFGVARAADTASLTMTGHLIGTPHYISPEQAEGASATPVSDVYSLGIVLYETLTGRKPFAGDTPVVTAVMHIREPLPPFPDSVPVQLQRITQVATAKDPAARFRSAGAMAAALRDESPDTRTYLLPDPGAGAGAGAGAAATMVRSHRELMSVRRLLAALVAVLLVAGGLWAAMASTDEPGGAPAAEASAEDGDDLVRVPARRLRGLPVAEARSELRKLGLRSRTEPRPNLGQQQPRTVAEVTPTGRVEPGTRILLSVWSDPPPVVAPEIGDESEGTGDGTPPGDRSTGGQTGQGGQGGQGGGPGSGKPAKDKPGTGPGSSQGGVNGNAGGNGKGNGGGNGGGNGPGNNPGKGSGKGGKR